MLDIVLNNLFSIVLAGLIALTILSVLTNPFNSRHIFRDPFLTQVEGNRIALASRYRLRTTRRWWRRLFAYFKAAYHIFGNVYWGAQKSPPGEADQIIAHIAALRFDVRRPYLISGDHFSVFYPRSLGVFYHCLLEPNLALHRQDWENRQQIYLKSTAFALSSFAGLGELYTTVVPVSRRRVAGIAIYSYPSDTAYSILHALLVLLGKRNYHHYYPVEASEKPYSLGTVAATQKLLARYRLNLGELVNDYIDRVYDPATGLVSTGIVLSGTKDITKRKGAFYDNVMLWSTIHLARQLNLTVPDIDLEGFKKRILERYWLEEEGFFLEDLSGESIQHHFYSSDWLVVLFTGFLNPAVPIERTYYERIVGYVQRSGMDQPFPLRYHPDDRGHRQFPLVRTFLPEYGGSAIWSFWGTEYIKALILLARYSGNTNYREQAQAHLAGYEKNIRHWQGFPEVYDSKGKMLSSWFYRSVRRTGWVINYTQAQSMLKSTDQTLTNSEST